MYLRSDNLYGSKEKWLIDRYWFLYRPAAIRAEGETDMFPLCSTMIRAEGETDVRKERVCIPLNFMKMKTIKEK